MPDLRTPADPSTPAPGQRLTVPERIRLWREDAAVLRRRGAGGLAELLEAVAAELEADHAADAPSELVDLRRAAALSGYTRGHLRRMLVERRLENCGTEKAPLVRTSDLPRKPARAPLPGGRPALSLREIALAVAGRTE